MQNAEKRLLASSNSIVNHLKDPRNKQINSSNIKLSQRGQDPRKQAIGTYVIITD